MEMEYERIEVECYSGCKMNERPVALTLRGTRLEVQDIVDRWYEGSREAGRPEIDYFKIRTTEGKVFIIRYQEQVDEWSIRI